MESFYDSLTRWQPFFAAVAGATATLVGLLFVSLSINREKITAAENRHLLRLAQRSFGDYLFAMFIALLFLVPNHETYGLAGPLFILAAVRGWFLIRALARAIKEQASTWGGWREQIFSVLSWLGLIVAGVEIYRGQILATFILVPVISLLLVNASMNAWALLIMEKNTDVKPPDGD